MTTTVNGEPWDAPYDTRDEAERAMRERSGAARVMDDPVKRAILAQCQAEYAALQRRTDEVNRLTEELDAAMTALGRSRSTVEGLQVALTNWLRDEPRLSETEPELSFLLGRFGGGYRESAPEPISNFLATWAPA